MIYYSLSVYSILLADGGDNPWELRQLAAGIILSDPLTYNPAMLDKTNKEYVNWLLRENSWGGEEHREHMHK